MASEVEAGDRTGPLAMAAGHGSGNSGARRLLLVDDRRDTVDADAVRGSRDLIVAHDPARPDDRSLELLDRRDGVAVFVRHHVETDDEAPARYRLPALAELEEGNLPAIRLEHFVVVEDAVGLAPGHCERAELAAVEPGIKLLERDLVDTLLARALLGRNDPQPDPRDGALVGVDQDRRHGIGFRHYPCSSGDTSASARGPPRRSRLPPIVRVGWRPDHHPEIVITPAKLFDFVSQGARLAKLPAHHRGGFAIPGEPQGGAGYCLPSSFGEVLVGHQPADDCVLRVVS